MILFLDFDGVLTDNRVWTDQDGRESVASNRSDSEGLSRLRKAGVQAVVALAAIYAEQAMGFSTQDTIVLVLAGAARGVRAGIRRRHRSRSRHHAGGSLDRRRHPDGAQRAAPAARARGRARRSA